jgi:hypothetical protein
VTTSVWNFPYPASTDPVGLGYLDIQTLAEAVDAAIGDPSFAQRRNLLDNGEMRVWQRGTSATGLTTTTRYTADRWLFETNANGTWRIDQFTTPGTAGFIPYLRIDSTTADATPAAADYSWLRQRIHFDELAGIRAGSATASPLTLSFWVRANQTGTMVVDLMNVATGTFVARSYQIAAANTWQKVALTFPGDTSAGGAIDPTAANPFYELRLWISAGSNYTSGTYRSTWSSSALADLAVGSTGPQLNGASSTANFFDFTSLQLEARSTAGPFDRRTYSAELAECSRYFQRIASTAANSPMFPGHMFTTTSFVAALRFPTMRAIPVATTSGTYDVLTTAALTGSGLTVSGLTPANGQITVTTSAGTAGHGAYLRFNSGTAIELTADI